MQKMQQHGATAPYPPAAPGPVQPYPGNNQQAGPTAPSYPQIPPQGAGGEPDNYQLPPDGKYVK